MGYNIIGYHIPVSAVSNPNRKTILSKLLGVDERTAKSLVFNPKIYSRVLEQDDISKQNQYPKHLADRNSYINRIMSRLTASDVRVLAKTLEEYSKLEKFSRIFPDRTTNKYLLYLDEVSYYDKLLDGFIYKYGNSGGEEGLERIRDSCHRNGHL